MSLLPLAEYLQTEPDGTLEAVAKQYNVTLLEVIKHLPQFTLASGEHFDLVWDSVCQWGKVTTIVHTQDIIAEFPGELPTGFHRHGFFNLRGKKGFTGHIKAENCTHIALVERKFMGTDTASILFLNGSGDVMFKIFVGRDEHRQLDTKQMVAYRELAETLRGTQA